MKYRKKPVVIEAMEFDGNNAAAIHEFMGNVKPVRSSAWDVIHIATLEGVMVANIGDWIIKGVKGEFYPCKPDIFEATYDREPDLCSTCGGLYGLTPRCPGCAND